MAQHPAGLPRDELLRDCEVRRQRRSGPGGQHRNKVETGIFIEHTPTGVRAEATEQRSQPKNQEIAIWRLRVRLAVEVRQPRASGGPPSELWMSRLRQQKIQINERHNDFPTLLAEALDELAGASWDAKAASQKLACSTSQLLKLLKKEPSAFTLMNARREQSGLPRLK